MNIKQLARRIWGRVNDSKRNGQAIKQSNLKSISDDLKQVVTVINSHMPSFRSEKQTELGLDRLRLVK